MYTGNSFPLQPDHETDLPQGSRSNSDSTPRPPVSPTQGQWDVVSIHKHTGLAETSVPALAA
jgi:hypothetical protein